MSNRPKIRHVPVSLSIPLLGRIGLGLHADSDGFLQSLGSLAKALTKDRVIIDFSNVTFIYPAGICIVVALGKFLIETRKCRIRSIVPSSAEVREFLSDAGFDKIVGIVQPAETVERPDTFRIKQVVSVDDDEIDQLINVIETELKFSTPYRARIHENIAEMVLNVVQHSNSPVGGFLIAQAYPTSHRIRYCITDVGIGIRKHLGRRYPELLGQNAVVAIEKAIVEGVTGSRKDANSGLGLADLRELVHLCGGEFAILSEDGLYAETAEYAAGTGKPAIDVKRRELDFSFRGTMVDIRLDSKPGYKVFKRDEPLPDEYTLIR